ncbi:MAG: argininosuccinate lyase, partial [Candidatus Angelobacter sp.]
MWSGRFRQPLDPHFEEWQRSFPFDQKLLRYELAASRAHAQALKAAGIVTPAEFGLIAAALDEIGKTSEQLPGYFNDPEAEDVHHF